MGLCHPPDGSTSPKDKLLGFKPPQLIQNALVFNWDMCCHLALCLQLLPFHSRNMQRCQDKVIGAKAADLFHQHLRLIFTAYFKLQLLRWVPYFDTILPNVVAIKSAKNYLHKNYSVLGPKMLVKLTPVVTLVVSQTTNFCLIALK
jgi:hypothetical protein